MTKRKPLKQKHEEAKVPHIETFIELKKEGRSYMLNWFDFSTYHLRDAIKKNPIDVLNIFLASFIVTVLLATCFFLLIFNKIEFGFSIPSYSFFGPGKLTISGKGKTGAILFDPMTLVSVIQKNNGSYILVDVRNHKAFDRGHIKTARSIPVSGTSLLSVDGSVDPSALRKVFSDVLRENKPLILYGDSAYSTYPAQIAQVLGFDRVQVLSIGWNEWAHFKNVWVPEAQWNTVQIDQLVQVKE